MTIPPFWKKHVEACEKSDLSVHQYAVKHGLSKSSIYLWRKRWLEQRPMLTREQFVPVSTLSAITGEVSTLASTASANESPSAPLSRVEITYPNGISLSCPCSVAPNWLADLVRAFR